MDACLDGSDGHQYLFNNQNFVYSVRGDPATPRIDARWGLRFTKVHADGQVDAAWQRDGVLFLSRGDRYVKYAHGLEWVDDEGERGSEKEREQDGAPNWSSIDAAFTDKRNTTWFFQGAKYVSLDAAKTFGNEADIKQRWGRERNEFTMPAAGDAVVVAGFSRDGRSFLIGPGSYTTYTGTDLMLCETPGPQSLRAILEQLHCSNSADVDASATIAGVMDGGAELLFKVRSGAGSDIYSLADNKVKKTKRAAKAGSGQEVTAFMDGNRRFAFTSSEAGLALTVSGSDERRVLSQDIRAALPAIDGNLYLFGTDTYVTITPGEISVAGIGNAVDQWASRSAPIANRWGRVRNAFTQGGPVTAALVRGEQAYLVSGDSYVRYSDAGYGLVDAGYPKPLAGNPDGLPPVAFRGAIHVPEGGPDSRLCFFIGTGHVFDDALSTPIPNRSRWGRMRTNILLRGVDTAYRVGGKHYLFSGNEVACYTAGTDGSLPAYMDGAPVRAELSSFGSVRGAFCFNRMVYLVGRDSFVCCRAGEPEQPLPNYPRNGRAGALVADLRRQFQLTADASASLPADYEVYALSLQGSVLLLDTDDNVPGQRVLRFDLSSGQLSRDWGPPQADWAGLRRDGNAYVDLAEGRYSFRADKVMKTPQGVAAAWDSGQEVRPIAAVWGGRPFDAAMGAGDELFLFVGDHFGRLPKAAASAAGDTGESVVVENLRAALAHRTPIRGSLTNLPDELLSGLDAALPVDDSLYLFKDDRFVRLSGDSRPKPVASLKYDLVRLTTSTAARLNRALFEGGVQRLLNLRTQGMADTPGFSVSTSSPAMIRVNSQLVNVDTLPLDAHLDFGSANGVYLWEIFFHAPFLIADMLSTAQRFEEAKAWYEYIFDPTEPADAWKFLPFLTEDVERIVVEIRDRLDRLQRAQVDIAALLDAVAGKGQLDQLLAMDAAFQGERALTDEELSELDGFKGLPGGATQQLDILDRRPEPEIKALGDELRELVGLVAELRNRWDSMQTSREQIQSYLDDPFDPHAIAVLRPIAYRKAIVMRYLDNLLSWGDMLFTQYTRESINEARMLYVAAWNVLGRRPESLGRRILPADTVYDGLHDAHSREGTRPGEYDMLLQLEITRTAELSFAAFVEQKPGEAQAQPYFFVPPNDELGQYWTRVADRLYKIRHGLNILGVQTPLALFEPPIDPMALVRAVAGAGGLAGLLAAAGAVDVPHYRFTFLVAKAQALVQKVTQLGAELLAALEKRDAEALNHLLNTQEAIILTLTRDVQKAQLQEAQSNLQSLEKARENAKKRQDTYQAWMDAGYLPMEGAQIGLLAAAVGVNTAAAILNAVAAGLALVPKSHIGLFSFGADTPEFHQAVQYAGGGLQTAAGAIQGVAEILGITAQHERTVQDWTLQRDLATIDVAQIDAQVEGARWQVEAARQQIVLADRQIEHNKAVADFYRRKFTNQELYEWMIGRLSDIHYQTFQLALDMARAAERSFQFERGRNHVDMSFVQGQPVGQPAERTARGLHTGAGARPHGDGLYRQRRAALRNHQEHPTGATGPHGLPEAESREGVRVRPGRIVL